MELDQNLNAFAKRNKGRRTGTHCNEIPFRKKTQQKSRIPIRDFTVEKDSRFLHYFVGIFIQPLCIHGWRNILFPSLKGKGHLGIIQIHFAYFL